MALPLVMKVVAEQFLLLGGAAWVARRWQRRRTVVLAYHNVVPDDSPRCGDLPVHLPLAQFKRQLDAVGRHFDVIPLERVFEPHEGGRPRAVITIDDAYAGVIAHGWPELRARGMPATCFVAPAFVDGGDFWWDVLAAASGGLAPALRERILRSLHGDDARAREVAAREELPLRAMPATHRVVCEGVLRAATAEGLRLGAHGWGHPAMPTLDDDALMREMERPRAWLRERFGEATSDWLAYPYGLWDDRVALAAERAGYQGALRADGGLMGEAPELKFRVPRVSIPTGLTRAGFTLRLVGLRR